MNRCFGRFILIIIVPIVIMSGCSQKQDDDKMEILFFGNLPTTLKESLEIVIGDHMKNVAEDYLQIELYPMSMEKIFIELTARNGDIYFIEQSYIHGIIDPLGLYPLDEVVDELILDKFILPEYKGDHPDTNDTHVYAVPVNNDSLLMRELGMELEESETLVAIIPAYSDKIEDALKILKQLAIQ